MAPDGAGGLDLPQQVQQLLGAAHGEGRDHQIAAPVQGVLKQGRQLGHIVRSRPVEPVAVGGFDDHEIRPVRLLGIPDQGTANIADIAGKQQGLVLHGHIDAGGAQQVACVLEPNLHAVQHIIDRAVLAGMEQLQRRLGVGDGIDRFHHRLSGALGLAVAPLGFRLLDVSRIQQHDAAELGRCLRGIDGAPEPLGHQSRNHAGVIHMGVGQENAVDLPGRHGQRRILVDVHALFHSVVHKNVLIAHLQIMTASRHLMIRANKNKLHPSPPTFSRKHIPLFFSLFCAYRASSAAARKSHILLCFLGTAHTAPTVTVSMSATSEFLFSIFFFRTCSVISIALSRT